jgi:DNA repair ATPase RecN
MNPYIRPSQTAYSFHPAQSFPPSTSVVYSNQAHQPSGSCKHLLEVAKLLRDISQKQDETKKSVNFLRKLHPDLTDISREVNQTLQGLFAAERLDRQQSQARISESIGQMFTKTADSLVQRLEPVTSELCNALLAMLQPSLDHLLSELHRQNRDSCKDLITPFRQFFEAQLVNTSAKISKRAKSRGNNGKIFSLADSTASKGGGRSVLLL